MNDIIALVIALVAHESGHYFHHLVFGYKPVLKWVGIGPCVESKSDYIPAKHILMNTFIAINLGLLILMIFHASQIAFFAYFVGCFMDVNNIQLILIMIKRKTITLDTNINDIKITIKGRQIT